MRVARVHQHFPKPPIVDYVFLTTLSLPLSQTKSFLPTKLPTQKGNQERCGSAELKQ